jgi:hypothetical protein
MLEDNQQGPAVVAAPIDNKYYIALGAAALLAVDLLSGGTASSRIILALAAGGVLYVIYKALYAK